MRNVIAKTKARKSFVAFASLLVCASGVEPGKRQQFLLKASVKAEASKNVNVEGSGGKRHIRGRNNSILRESLPGSYPI